MKIDGIEDKPTRLLVEALVAQPSIKARKRWALMQLSLWQEQGLVEPLLEPGCYRATASGRYHLQQALLEQQLSSQPDPEGALQSLALELPARCHRHVLAALLKGGRHHLWREAELDALIAEGTQPVQDGVLRLRGYRHFSLFFEQGALLDAAPQLELLGELILPEAALQRLHKVLWQGHAPEYLITVDSRAAFVTLTPASDELLLLTPAVHTQLAERFLSRLTPGFAWGHLCDWHPKALAQALTLAERLKRPLRLLLPQQVAQLAACYGRPLAADASWANLSLPAELQTVLEPLITKNVWLEQESLVLFASHQLSGTRVG
ncbi:MAG: hypothetical protein ACRCRW_14960 [Aeromonadaceae bacterium]